MMMKGIRNKERTDLDGTKGNKATQGNELWRPDFNLILKPLILNGGFELHLYPPLVITVPFEANNFVEFVLLGSLGWK